MLCCDTRASRIGPHAPSAFGSRASERLVDSLSIEGCKHVRASDLRTYSTSTGNACCGLAWDPSGTFLVTALLCAWKARPLPSIGAVGGRRSSVNVFTFLLPPAADRRLAEPEAGTRWVTGGEREKLVNQKSPRRSGGQHGVLVRPALGALALLRDAMRQTKLPRRGSSNV